LYLNRLKKQLPAPVFPEAGTGFAAKPGPGKQKIAHKMANTPSNMLPLGTKAPDFSLLDTVSGQTLTLGSEKGSKGTVIMFICNHCPFVKHVNPQITKLAAEYQEMGIGFIAISSNDAENYPQDAPHLMKVTAQNEGYSFPYLYDKSQQVAKDYQAACTPDFYLFDAQLRLVYRGQLDDSRPGNGIPVSGKDLKAAMDALLNGKAVSSVQKPSIGCNIKWLKQ
jgi:thiol-disulfide isomerase/thioredoxin